MSQLYRRNDLINLILNHPPELPKMAKTVKYFDRIREPDFFRKMAFWVFPGIDTTAFALQILQVLFANYQDGDLNLKIDELRNTNLSILKKFVLSLHDESCGGFYQTSQNHFPTLHATHCSIALVKAVVGRGNGGEVDYDSLIGSREVDRFYGADMGNSGSLSSKIIDFVSRCYDQESGGFFETPVELLNNEGVSRRPSIVATSSAMWICHQLGIEIEEFLEKYCRSTKEKVTQFVYSLRVKKDGSTSFKNTTKSEQPWICSCYYAERLLRNLGEMLSDEDIIGMLTFIIKTKNKHSAFCAGDRLDANLIHTKNALSIITRYHDRLAEISKLDGELFDGKTFLIETYEDVLSFMRETYVDGGFSPAESFRYMPNIYSTRMALDIFRYFKVLPALSGVEMRTPEFLDKGKVVTFLAACYSKEAGAFRGYPYLESYIPRGYMEEHFLVAA